jgi:hypothetical protein
VLASGLPRLRVRGVHVGHGVQPTDTAPLSPRAKALMMLNAAVSLASVVLVAARAVNAL